MAADNTLRHLALGSMAKTFLVCLQETIDSERSDHAACETHNYTAADDSDSLGLTQLRGFRNELTKYYDQPLQVGRLLRVVRRLHAKNYPSKLISTTAIALAACLLFDNPRFEVKQAGMGLVRKWMQQFNDDSIFPKGGGPPSAAFKKITNAMSLWQARVTYEMNHPSPETKAGKEKKEPLKITNETFEKVTKEMFEKISGHRLKGLTSNAESSITQPGSRKQRLSIDKDTFLSYLGTSVVEALKHLRGGEITEKAVKRHLSPEAPDESRQNTFDSIAIVLKNAKIDAQNSLVYCPNHDEEWITNEFLKGAQSYLQLDDESLGLLSAGLQSFQTAAIGVFYRVSMNHMVRVLGESYLGVLENRVGMLETMLEKDGESKAKIRPEYLGTLKLCKEFIAGLKKQMERELLLQRDDSIKSTVQLLHPVKIMLEMVDPSGKLPRNLASLLNATKEVANLQLKVSTLLADLTASQVSERNLTEKLKSCWSENRKLQKLVEVERTAMHKKYFSDIETQVEARLQSEKTKSDAYISDIEPKAKRADAAEEALAQVQEALKNVTRERDGLASRNVDLDAACKQLRADKAATERGYEQICQEKDECELKLVTVEADLIYTQTQLEDLQAQTLQAAKSEVINKSHDIAQTGISVLTHVDQLTKLDRLDMIAQRWRNDLSLAQAEKQEYSNALQATEDQIAIAEQRLRELKPLENFEAHPHENNAGQAHRGPRGRAPVPSAPRISSRSRTPEGVDFPSAVSYQALKRPETAVVRSTIRRGGPAQNVSWKLFGKDKPVLILVQEEFPPLSIPRRPVRGSPRAKILRLL